MPLTEPDLWISHIRLFDSSHATRTSRIGTVPLHRPVPAKAYGAPFAYSDTLQIYVCQKTISCRMIVPTDW
jgi:hypothetical protein